jgi:putative peptidoglycan lipid II flippase
MAERFVAHTRTVTLLTLMSRVTGLARDALFSRLFGSGTLLDAFFFAFMIPNLFRRLFGEGALSAAFLPAYTRLDRDDPATAKCLATLTVATTVAVLGAVVLGGEALLAWALSRSAGGGLPLRLMMIMLPYMPLVCLVALLGAMLQVHGRFGPTAAAPIILNLVMIGAALGFEWLGAAGAAGDRTPQVVLVSAGVVLAGVIQVSWALVALRRRRWWRWDPAAARKPAREVLRLALPMIVGLGVLQLNTFFDGVIASYPSTVGPTILGRAYPLETGAMTVVSFAQRLYQFPLGVFGVALATAIFPALARQFDDESGFRTTLQRGLRLVMFIGLPASAGLVLVRRPLAAVFLEGGAFTASDSGQVARVLLGYGSAVWAYSTIHVLARAYYARGDSLTPLRVAMAMVALNLALNVTLIWTPLREAGLAWSTATCAVIQMTLLLTLLRRRIGRLVDPAVVGSWARTAAMTAVMAACVAIVLWLLGPGATWGGQVVALVAGTGTGVAVFVGAARALRMPELRWAVGRV